MTSTCTIRPCRWSDIRTLARIDFNAFTFDEGGRNFFGVIFNGIDLDEHRDALIHSIERLLQMRYYSPDTVLSVLEEQEDQRDLQAEAEKKTEKEKEKRIVAFANWRMPKDEMPGLLWRCLSPYSWYASLWRAILTARNYLFPIRSLKNASVMTFFRAMAKLEPTFMTTQRRRDAWYLAVLAVQPGLHGRGHGRLLLEHGLRRVDASRGGAGAATWLIGLKGLDRYYARYGFVTVARANVGELSAWDDGGFVMFRE